MNNDTSKYYIPFINAVAEVLQNSGIEGIERQDVQMNKALSMSYEVNVIISLTGDIHGNIGISMPRETAVKISSAVLNRTTTVDQLDNMSQNAINDTFKKMAENALIKLSSEGKNIEASLPTLVVGKNLTIVISRVHTISLTLSTSAGPFQLNICLESVR